MGYPPGRRGAAVTDKSHSAQSSCDTETRPGVYTGGSMILGWCEHCRQPVWKWQGGYDAWPVFSDDGRTVVRQAIAHAPLDRTVERPRMEAA